MKTIVTSLTMLIALSCNEGSTNTESKMEKIVERSLSLFEPSIGCLVFAGQDLESIGGTAEYNNGYCDHFSLPAGLTLYTSIGAMDDSFGGKNKALGGMDDIQDYGNGPTSLSYVLENSRFQDMALAIGLSMVNSEIDVASGKLDSNIIRLASFLKAYAPRPIFLRVGYEFDGYTWNHYDREAFKKAYIRVKQKFDELNVSNVAFVWQSVGWVSNPYQLEEWYPGNEYVDWCGFSFFDRWREVEMIDFARQHNKPVFIAEASPAISDFTAKFDADCKSTFLSNEEHAQEAYEKWFIPFFNMVENNRDVIKAIHYINCDWSSREMWKDNPVFKDIDARIQTSDRLSEFWNSKMGSPHYLNTEDSIYQILKII